MSRGGSRIGRPMVIAAAIALIYTGSVIGGQMATADRLSGPGWWPTKGTAARTDYAGAAACRQCHPAQSASQPLTSMARTAGSTASSDVLRASPRLTFTSGGYSYEIVSDDKASSYKVTSGTQSSSAPLTWTFGAGKVGQSFLFNREGSLYEARVSYYDAIHALGFTPGRAVSAPKDLDEAMARRVDDAEARRCFACHTTAPVTQGKFDPSNAVPGITCEVCHGPGRRHVDAMKVSPSAGKQGPMLNPAHLQPEESVDFCGACHATFWDVTLAGEQGLSALRSQPYRLRSSKCWTEGDARLTCVACHDPHRPLVTEARAYDERCLSCHVTTGHQPTPERAGHACPVGTPGCATCHMPKYEIPDMHREFTDHQIRRPSAGGA